jgi:WD40 repeat protein
VLAATASTLISYSYNIGRQYARVWETSTCNQVAVLRGHSDTITVATFNNRSSRVVTASKDKTARLWDAATGRQIAVLYGHAGAVNTAAFSPSGTYIVTGSSDKTARLWTQAPHFRELSFLTPSPASLRVWIVSPMM